MFYVLRAIRGGGYCCSITCKILMLPYCRAYFIGPTYIFTFTWTRLLIVSSPPYNAQDSPIDNKPAPSQKSTACFTFVIQYILIGCPLPGHFLVSTVANDLGERPKERMLSKGVQRPLCTLDYFVALVTLVSHHLMESLMPSKRKSLIS